MISEPAAACLAYGLGQSDPEERFHAVVLRIGGRGMDASLVLVNHGLMSIVETVSRDDFGGDTITGLVADYLAAEFERFDKIDMNINVLYMRRSLFQNKKNINIIHSTFSLTNT